MPRFASWRHLLVVLLPIGLGACGGGAQMMRADQPAVLTQGEAMVVFMRSSLMGSAISASLFDVSGPETKFIGIINHGTKIAYPVKPGEHTFMVVSEAADFMQAKVVPGRTYYALVTPRPGMWKARFSFRPVRQNELGGGEFAGWDSATHFVANSPATLNWASQNAADVNSKRVQYWTDWIGKPAGDRASQTLDPEDGKASALSAAPAEKAAPSNVTAEKLAPVASIAPAASASGGRMPRQGDTWTYRLTAPDLAARSFKVRRYTVLVAAVSDTVILDRFHLEGGPSGDSSHDRGKYLVSMGPSLFSPYLPVFEELSSAGPLPSIEIKDENCKLRYLCEAEGRIVGRETVWVPAGSFETVKVVVNHSWRPLVIRQQSMPPGWTGSRQLTIWYSPAVKRAVKFTSRVSGRDAPSDSHFDLELESYRVQ